MAYIGAEPVPGQNREIDDISSGFNGSATAFTLQVSSTNVSPESANNILVNLGGVMQNPGTDYTIAASTITFTTAPASGLSFWALILGAGINTATVADDTIGSSKLIDTAVTAGSYTTADITVDAQGRITAAASGTISGAEIADQAVTNAKVNNSAAIAGSKISPDFGSQAISTTGGLSINGATVFNESGADVDFRIEGDSDANNFYLDASTNRIGLGIASPTSKLYVNTVSTEHVITAATADTNGNSIINILSAGTTGNSRILFSDTAGADAIISYSHNDGGLIFGSHGAVEDMRIDALGRVLIGHSTITPVDNDANNPHFQVEGTGADDSRISIRHNSTTASNPASIYLSRSKGTSTGSKTSVASGDALGSLIFMGADGTHDTRAAIIQASCDGTPGDNDMPGRLEFFTTPDGGLNSVERMRIDSSGDVFIKTNDVKLSGSGTLRINSGSTAGTLNIDGGSSNHGGEINLTGGSNGGRIQFRTGQGSGQQSERMRIDENGRVMIGTTSTSGISSSGDDIIIGSIGDSTSRGITFATTADATIRWADAGDNAMGRIQYVNSTDIMTFHTSNAERLNIDSNGTAKFTQTVSAQGSDGFFVIRSAAATNVQNDMIAFECGNQGRGKIVSGSSDGSAPQFSSGSDYRMKENIRDYTQGYDNIKAIPVKLFDMVTDGAKDIKGWVAHEVQSYIPEAVIGDKDAVVTQAMVDSGESEASELGNDVMQNLAYGAFMPDVVSALQAAITKIETLETKVAALEAA